MDKLLGKPSAGKPLTGKTAGKTDAPKTSNPLGKRVEVQVAEHGIDPNLLDERAVRVVQTLTDGGFEAYIVGGAVRD
ncbi:polynucleotide adenylyltransferase PcnB, partial [Roseateles sp. GG27B]